MAADIQTTLLKLADRIKSIEKKLRNPTPDSMGGYWVTMQPWGQVSAVAYAASNNSHLIIVPRDCTIKKFVVGAYTQSPNNVSNYWSFKLTDGLGIDHLQGWDFHTDAVNTWVRHSYTGFDEPTLTVAGVYLVMSITKVGAPGTLTVGNPMLYFT